MGNKLKKEREDEVRKRYECGFRMTIRPQIEQFIHANLEGKVFSIEEFKKASVKFKEYFEEQLGKDRGPKNSNLMASAYLVNAIWLCDMIADQIRDGTELLEVSKDGVLPFDAG